MILLFYMSLYFVHVVLSIFVFVGGNHWQSGPMVSGQTSSNIQKIVSKYLTVLRVTTSQKKTAFPAVW